MVQRPAWQRLCLAFTFSTLIAGTAAAAGAGAAGSPNVQGVVVRPAKVEAPPSPHVGFLPPLENPIVEIKQYDPFPEMVVVLDGVPADPASKTAVAWQLKSHSFDPPLIAVVIGTTIEIANVGRETHLLQAIGREDLLPRELIGPESTRSFNPPATPDAAVRIISLTSPHLQGRVVTLPTRYFSRVDRNGRFKIENVPPGRWSLKIWYRDGWVKLPDRSVDVPGKDVRVDLTAETLAGAAEGK